MNEWRTHRRVAWIAIVLIAAGQGFGRSEPRLPLARAAHEGNLELIKKLLAEGQDQYERDSALDFAIQARHREITELLIAHGARYALFKAASFGDFELVQDLLGPGTEAKDIDSAFHAAVRMQHKSVAEFLLAQGADVDTRRWGDLTPLFAAVTGNSDGDFTRWTQDFLDRQKRSPRDLPKTQEMVDFLIQHGADVNAVGGSPKLVPLYYAIHGGSAKIVETLLEHGAEADFRVQSRWLDSRFTTPLHLAADYGDLTMCELLIRHGADVNARMPMGDDSGPYRIQQTPLHHAARSGNVQLVELLLDHGADVNGLDSLGETALHRAIWHDKQSIVELLLSREADVNVAGKRGQTPLHYAAQQKAPAVAATLLERGADAHARNREGETAMSIATENGSDEIVRLLTARLGQATLHGAASMGDIATLARLVESGTSVDRVDIQDRTALHAAVQAGQIEAVEWLLTHGADPNYPDENGITPLSVALHIAQDYSFSRDPNEVARFNALKIRQRRILVLLLEHGAAPDFRLGIPEKTVMIHPKEVAELLVESGVNFEPGVDERATLPHRAAWWGETDVAAQLLDLGADVNAPTGKAGLRCTPPCKLAAPGIGT